MGMPRTMHVILAHVVYFAIIFAIVWLVLDYLDEHDLL